MLSKEESNAAIKTYTNHKLNKIPAMLLLGLAQTRQSSSYLISYVLAAIGRVATACHKEIALLLTIHGRCT